MRSQREQNFACIGEINPIVPRLPGSRYRSDTPSRSKNSSSGSARFTASEERNVFEFHPAAQPIGINSMNRTQMTRSFVSAAEQNGLTLVAVSLNPKKIDESDKGYVEAFTDSIRMFKYGFLQYDFKSFKEMCQLCDSSLMSVQVQNAG